MVPAISLQHFAGAENLDLGLLVLAYFGSYPNLAPGLSHLFTLDYGTGLGPLPFYTAPRRYTTAFPSLAPAPRRQPNTFTLPELSTCTRGLMTQGVWACGCLAWVKGGAG